MAILVTGGAGYIGSVTVERLTNKGESIVALDDLAHGRRESIDDDVPFYQGSVGDRALIARIVKDHAIESCVHFASLISVGESEQRPAEYFENNVQQGISLIGALLQAGVRHPLRRLLLTDLQLGLTLVPALVGDELDDRDPSSRLEVRREGLQIGGDARAR